MYKHELATLRLTAVLAVLIITGGLILVSSKDNSNQPSSAVQPATTEQVDNIPIQAQSLTNNTVEELPELSASVIQKSTQGNNVTITINISIQNTTLSDITFNPLIDIFISYQSAYYPVSLPTANQLSAQIISKGTGISGNILATLPSDANELTLYFQPNTNTETLLVNLSF